MLFVLNLRGGSVQWVHGGGGPGGGNALQGANGHPPPQDNTVHFHFERPQEAKSWSVLVRRRFTIHFNALTVIAYEDQRGQVERSLSTVMLKPRTASSEPPLSSTQLHKSNANFFFFFGGR